VRSASRCPIIQLNKEIQETVSALASGLEEMETMVRSLPCK